MAYKWVPIDLSQVGFEWDGGFYPVRKYSFIPENHVLVISYYVYRSAYSRSGTLDLTPRVDLSFFPGIRFVYVLDQKKRRPMRVWQCKFSGV